MQDAWKPYACTPLTKVGGRAKGISACLPRSALKASDMIVLRVCSCACDDFPYTTLLFLRGGGWVWGCACGTKIPSMLRTLLAQAYLPSSQSPGLCLRTWSSIPTDKKSLSSADAAQTSSTGRLLDLFSTPEATSAPSSSASPGPMKQKKEQVSPENDVTRLVLQAVENCKPLMKVMSIKTGTRIIHVPKVVLPPEQRSLAVRCVALRMHPARHHA